MSIGRMENRRPPLLRDALDRMFGEGSLDRFLFPGRMGAYGEDQWVPMNVFELPEGLMLVLPMPGLQPDDVELTVAESSLTIRGRRSPGQDDKEYLVKEWDYGPYLRTVDLPFPIDADRIIATLDNGVLTVNMRRSEASMPRRIQIKSAAERSAVGGETHHSEAGMQREGSTGV